MSCSLTAVLLKTDCIQCNAPLVQPFLMDPREGGVLIRPSLTSLGVCASFSSSDSFEQNQQYEEREDGLQEHDTIDKARNMSKSKFQSNYDPR